MKGLTFVEMLVSLALMLFIALALATLYFNFDTLVDSQSGQVAAATDAARVMSEAEALVLPADQVLASHTFSGTVYSSSAQTLVLELPSIDSSGAVIASTYDYVVFYQSGSTTTRILSPNASSARKAGTRTLASTLSSLAFTYDSSDFTQVTKVDADIQTVKIVKGKSDSAHLHEALYLRNH
jgi:hypothetical protein